MSETELNSLKEMRDRLNKCLEDDEKFHRRRKAAWIRLSILAVGAVILGYITIPKFQLYRKGLEAYRTGGDYIYDAVYWFGEAKINNSEEWLSAIQYGIGTVRYNEGDYLGAVTYLEDSDRPRGEMFLDASVRAVEEEIEWEDYESALSHLDSAMNVAYVLGDTSADDKINTLRDQAEYYYGKSLYESGEYETAKWHLQQSSWEEAAELLSDIENALQTADSEEWQYICSHGDSTALSYLSDLYNTDVLEECYAMFGNDKDNWEFSWNNDPDTVESQDTVSGGSKIYCHYAYYGEEDVTAKILYVYNGGNSSYTFDRVIEAYESGWFSTSFGNVPASGYFYAFYYNADTDEPLAASRVWIE